MFQQLLNQAAARLRQADESFGAFRNPWIVFVSIVLFLYLFATFTLPINFDSLNSLDGHPIIHAQVNATAPSSSKGHSTGLFSVVVVGFLFGCLLTGLTKFILRRRGLLTENDTRRSVINLLHHFRQRFTGNMSEADRIRLQLALSNRDFNGDDYERLLQLDGNDGMGNRNRGISESEINRMPLHTFTMGTSSSSSSQPQQPSADIRQCAICLEPYQEGDSLRTVM
jgi:hypothetical protein